jgi:hypothetical protein
VFTDLRNYLLTCIYKIKIIVCEYVGLCSLIDREGLHRFSRNLTCLCLETGKYFRKVRTPESSLGSCPGEDFFCSSETKYDRRTTSYHNCLFRRDYRNKGHIPIKVSRVRVLVRMFSVTRKLSMIEERCPKLSASAKRLHE